MGNLRIFTSLHLILQRILARKVWVSIFFGGYHFKCLLFAEYLLFLYPLRFRHGNCILEFNISWKIQVPRFVEHIFTCKFFDYTILMEKWDIVAFY